MTAAPIPFRKMNGLGNAFAVIDARDTPVNLSGDAIRALGGADRIGFDQLITLEPDRNGADAFMRIHNRDGGEVEACGNATRCVGWLLMKESGRENVKVQTSAGLLLASSGGEPDIVSVDMGVPRFGWRDIPTAEAIADTRAVPVPLDAPGADALGLASLANMGNPHAIFWVADIEAHDLERLGPLLEHHPMFPERANISLARIDGPEAITVRTWERGVGLTRACGTAACATAVSAHRLGRTGRTVTVTLPGGPLSIAWRDDDHVIMTGAIENEYTGAIDPQTLAFTREGTA